MEVLYQSQRKQWIQDHGKHWVPPPLHPALRKMILKWFQLVDEDGSNTLEFSELSAALKVS